MRSRCTVTVELCLSKFSYFTYLLACIPSTGVALDSTDGVTSLDRTSRQMDWDQVFNAIQSTEGPQINNKAHARIVNGMYTVSQKKLCKLIFCQNFAKFRRIVKIFGTKIAERTRFSEVYSFSTSPNFCQHTTVWNSSDSEVIRHAGAIQIRLLLLLLCSKLLHNAVIISLQ